MGAAGCGAPRVSSAAGRRRGGSLPQARAAQGAAGSEQAVRHWRGEVSCYGGARPAAWAKRSDSGFAAGPRGGSHAAVGVGRGRKHRVAAMGGLTKEIPIFPLNMVAMPYAITPLHIFEARYRVMFSTILQGEPGVEEGLVDEDSPFAGSREFGMCLTTQQGMATIGTTLRVEEFSHLPDGRLLVTNKGVERFKVLDVVRESPYVVCRVEVLEDDDYDSVRLLTKARSDSPASAGFDGPVSVSGDDENEDRDGEGDGGPGGDDDDVPPLELPGDDWAEGGVQHLSGEVSTLLKDTIRLTAKMNGAEEPELPAEFTQLELDPHRFSFWVASVFSAPAEQQHILEMRSTADRLKREKEVLTSTLDYLKASTAIKGVFNDDGGGPATGDSGVSP